MGCEGSKSVSGPSSRGLGGGSPARIRTSIHGSKGHKMAPDISERTSEMCARPHLRLLDVRFHTSKGHKTSAKHTARTKPRTKLKRYGSRNQLKTLPLNIAGCESRVSRPATPSRRPRHPPLVEGTYQGFSSSLPQKRYTPNRKDGSSGGG